MSILNINLNKCNTPNEDPCDYVKLSKDFENQELKIECN